MSFLSVFTQKCLHSVFWSQSLCRLKKTTYCVDFKRIVMKSKRKKAQLSQLCNIFPTYSHCPDLSIPVVCIGVSADILLE